jgi:hypothetical protein
MIAFSRALYNIISVRGGGGNECPTFVYSMRCLFHEMFIPHHFLTSCEAYSSLWETFLKYLESDPTNETNLNEHSLPVEIVTETVIKLSRNYLRRDLNALKPGMLTVNRLFK